jgi:hemolysin activation/secretion protein
VALGLSAAGTVCCSGAILLSIVSLPVVAAAETAPEGTAASAMNAALKANTPPVQRLDVFEFRIDGAHLLDQPEVEEAVYPFLGPDRSTDDIEEARAALEKAYFAKGYQTVAVEIPQQQVQDGVVLLKVVEGKVGRLRVNGSRYFSLDEIKEEAPSLAEGTVPNFNDVSKDIVALNQIPDRRVTPALRAGATPGTVDVDLNVEDTLPLHGSLEINNRYSQNTVPLRLNATLRYNNLWQLGHSVSVSYQIAPQDPSNARVISTSYLAPVPGLTWLNALVYAVKNDSNVATIGDTNVVGRGKVIGTRAIVTLPGEQDFFHTLSMGVDYKHFDQNLSLSGSSLATPITYYPVTLAYNATLQGKEEQTQFDASVVFHVRGIGSGLSQFDAQRFNAQGDFIYFRGDLARTQELPLGLQLYGKAQGQVANEPLISTEEFSAGGLDTVRGYLESEVLGDNGLIGSVELRSPSLAPWLKKVPAGDSLNEWRFYFFAEGGGLSINSPLPEQQSQFQLASVGIGTRLKLLDYLNGSLDLGVPLFRQVATPARYPRLSFRVWSEL